MSGQESTDTARGRATGGADETSSADAAGPASSAPAEGGVGDAWVVGAWSTEGWMSATSPEQAPLDDDNLEAEAIEAGAPLDASAGPAGGTPAGPVSDAGTGADAGADAATGAGSARHEPATAEVTAPPSGPPVKPAPRDHPPVPPGAAAERPASVPTTERGPDDDGAVAPSPTSHGRNDAASAAELTEDAIVRFRGDRPSYGWRRAVYRATAGLVNPGIGPDERDRQEQQRRIRRPLRGSHQIAVSSLKGGVGKTTVSACLGLVLAENRGDRVIALDANPDAGTLADRLTTETSVTVRNLLDNLDSAYSLTDVARYTSLAGRLQVLASEQDPAMSEAFSRDEYERVCQVLTRFYNIVITDSGTGLVHSAMEGTLALADSLVVVGAPTVDGASRASKTLDWLIAHGHAAHVADAVVVLSCDRVSKDVDRARVREHFEARCRAVVEVPHDPHLATGGRIELSRLRPPTQDAFLALAAHLADGFAATPRSAEPVAGRRV